MSNSLTLYKPIRDLWISALTSGEFVQGKGFLRIGINDDPQQNSYCCLGVLCELHSRATGTKWEVSKLNEGISTYLNAGTYLPEDVQRWAGLSGYNPSYSGYGNTLSRANDKGLTFAEIAAIIADAQILPEPTEAPCSK
jgi:hypothetical protein